MKLVTKEILKKLQAQDPYAGKEPENPMVVVKFFDPFGSWTWYAVSGSQDPDSGDIQFFGYVKGLENELGYFWLSELENIKLGDFPRIERDLYFKPMLLSEVMRITEGGGHV